MTFQHTARFDSPIDEVFAWHRRPGAIQRLTPPWQPVKVASESPSLREGRAVLALPGGLNVEPTEELVVALEHLLGRQSVHLS